MRYRRVFVRYGAVATAHMSAAASARLAPLVSRCRAAFQPPVDVFETRDAVSVKVEIAGFAEDELQVTITTASS
jgi:HSP20 family molecular chaperone IbpA